MPRAQLATQLPAVALPDGPLTVAAVSVRLGVSPSTLRTWERRYGLGSDTRVAGTHRRYGPADFARLSRMVELIHAGVPTAEAAALVLGNDMVSATAECPCPAKPQDLIETARADRPSELLKQLEAAIENDGLVRTWTHLIEPALMMLRESPTGEIPGHAPSAHLTTAVHHVLAEISEVSVRAHANREKATEQEGAALILADAEHELAAHVAGVALQWHGLNPAIMAMTSCCSDKVSTFIHSNKPRLVLIAGQGTICEKVVEAILADEKIEVILLGADAPTVLNPRVVRVRTLAAAVEESLALTPNL